ncbi:MAG TPA: TetR/AcrR family transcriptional regulator [Acidobacteriaceae bacterium]|nr:TetR/AcrR family transcriptional regulator [Acidobacteriaceae bacterium]
MGRPAARPGRDARELLLTASVELFAEHGVAATTFAMIAARAGLTPAMLHYYFTDRDALIDAVVDERLATLITSVWDPVQPGAAAEVTVGGIVDRLLIGIELNPWVPSTWMREVLNDGGLLRSRVVRRLPFERVRLVSEAIARGQKAGTVNPEVDPVLMVFSTIGLVMLHMATMRFFAETFNREVPKREAIRRHITGLLLHGLKWPPSPARRSVRRKK